MRIDLRSEHERSRRWPAIGTRTIGGAAAIAGVMAIATTVVGSIHRSRLEQRHVEIRSQIEASVMEADAAALRASEGAALWERLEHASRSRSIAPIAHVLATVAEGVGDTISLSRLTISMPTSDAPTGFVVGIDLEGRASSSEEVARCLGKLSGQAGLDRVRLVNAQQEQSAAGFSHRCTMSMALAMRVVEIPKLGALP